MFFPVVFFHEMHLNMQASHMVIFYYMELAGWVIRKC